ncbi:sister chromatid cohesion protein Dcc1 [Nitzschia inconspicua]|uniref:Sister chromatid cohesion protein Dcc1 n=1 Tax=Nitzschia inconspicua TaxID=303405 RepID=A0A9K3K5F9_9STRA|nr:sister chromatid cohesion protein Dcc1 [Nitzschia inconspicua]KAG7372433.1 sister chromatid cohesion protein Dcc1 [Nitzschia inconspicua]
MSAHRTAEVSSETDGILLSLPQSDLPTKTKNQGIGAATATKVADLVLFQLPPSVEFQNDFYGGNCQIVANNQSASLVSPTTSFRLVTVGTSNTLVVWKDEKERNNDGVLTSDADEDSSTASPPPTKRSKPTAPVTSCRLIQPGGSGASFLIGQPHTIDPTDLFQWFEQRRRQYNNAAGMVSTSTLSNLFQTSTMEIQTVLSKIPNIVAIQQSEVEQYWQLVPDEEVFWDNVP